jgi:SAM-dependent methyltransferase
VAEERFYDTERSELRDSVFDRDNRHDWFNNLFFQTVYSLSSERARILDIGTGNGFVLRELLSRFPSKDYTLFGVDNSLEMVNVAVKNLNLDAQIFVGDNYSLALMDGYFDVVTAKNVTRFSSEEIARVLKPNGYFVLREYGKNKGLKEITELFPGRIIRSRKPSFYINTLKEAGFADIELKEFEVVRRLAPENLIKILEMFPFIRGFSEKDKEKVLRLERNGSIKFTSDPILITGRKNGRL